MRVSENLKVLVQKARQILRKRSHSPRNRRVDKLLEFKLESLILAQNERWRQA